MTNGCHLTPGRGALLNNHCEIPAGDTDSVMTGVYTGVRPQALFFPLLLRSAL